MSESIDAVFDGGVFRPCHPVSIPDGQRVTLTFEPVATAGTTATWPDLPPELVRNADGVIVARGSRISLFFLLECHFAGTPWSQMAEDLPTVGRQDWPAIEAFVRHNETVLRPYLDAQQKRVEAYRKPTPPGLTLEKLRERFEKKYGAPFPKP